MAYKPEVAAEYAVAIHSAELAAQFIRDHPGCQIACGLHTGRSMLFFVVYGGSYSRRHEVEIPTEAPDSAIEIALAASWKAVQSDAPNTVEPEAQEECEPGPLVDDELHDPDAVCVERDGVITREDPEAACDGDDGLWELGPEPTKKAGRDGVTPWEFPEPDLAGGVHGPEGDPATWKIDPRLAEEGDPYIEEAIASVPVAPAGHPAEASETKPAASWDDW